MFKNKIEEIEDAIERNKHLAGCLIDKLCEVRRETKELIQMVEVLKNHDLESDND